MRWVALLIAAACGGCGNTFDGCANPCPGAFSTNLEWLCDAGPCPVGQSFAEPFFQCRCFNGETFTFRQPDAGTCSAARAQWNAFFAAFCGHD
jgi:hypothetical protein